VYLASNCFVPDVAATGAITNVAPTENAIRLKEGASFGKYLLAPTRGHATRQSNMYTNAQWVTERRSVLTASPLGGAVRRTRDLAGTHRHALLLLLLLLLVVVVVLLLPLLLPLFPHAPQVVA